MNSIAISAILAGALLTDGAFGVESGVGGITVRVQETRGGPQIHVDGKPVPPRFLFGSTNSGTITAKLVDLEQTRQVMRRNTAQAALRGFGTWWMDLPAQGGFNDTRIWEEMSLLHPVDDAMLERQGPFAPKIAAVVDEESICHLPGGSAAFAADLTYNGRAAPGRSGAPYGQYLLDDVLVGRVPAKLQVFLSAWVLSPAKRATLAGQRGPGVTRVRCYAPGSLYPDRADGYVCHFILPLRPMLASSTLCTWVKSSSESS